MALKRDGPPVHTAFASCEDALPAKTLQIHSFRTQFHSGFPEINSGPRFPRERNSHAPLRGVEGGGGSGGGNRLLKGMLCAERLRLGGGFVRLAGGPEAGTAGPEAGPNTREREGGLLSRNLGYESKWATTRPASMREAPPTIVFFNRLV